MLRFAGPGTAVLLAGLVAAACADTPSQPAQARTTAKLEILAGDGQTGGAGEELPTALVVRAVDSAGQPVSGQIVNFRIVSGGGSVFAGANVTGADGIAREYWTLGVHDWDPQVLEARAVDNAISQKIVFGTFNATVVGTTPHAIGTLCCHAERGVVGQTMVDSLKVQVMDRYGNEVPNVQVTWTVIEGNGRVSGPSGPGSTAVTVADSLGSTWVRFTPGTTAGTNTVRVTAGSAQTNISITGVPGAPVRFTADPSSLLLAGVNATGKVKGWGYDRYHNRVTAYRARWSALEPAIVSVLTPSSTQTDTVATVRGNAQGTGRVVGTLTVFSKVYADTVEVTVP